jgi:hypothetical protein
MTLELGTRPLSCPLTWPLKAYQSQLQSDFQPSTWVQLLETPSLFSHDEALLLCQQSRDEWVAWIPNHGEVVLHVSQFYQLPDVA